MGHLTVDERVKIVKTYYKSGGSVIGTFRALRKDYGRRKRPSERTIGKTMKKFEGTGSVTDVLRPIHHRNASSAENIAAVSESVKEDPSLSIKRRAQHLGLSYGTLWRILHVDLPRQKETPETNLTANNDSGQDAEVKVDTDNKESPKKINMDEEKVNGLENQETNLIDKFTIDERITIVKTYYKNQHSVETTASLSNFDNKEPPSADDILSLVSMFENTGSLVTGTETDSISVAGPSKPRSRKRKIEVVNEDGPQAPQQPPKQQVNEDQLDGSKDTTEKKTTATNATVTVCN